ncbi:MAG: VanZ family protein [Bacteroidota bacterium]
MHRLLVALAAGFTGFIGWVIYIANTGQDSVVMDWARDLPYGDKLGHLVLFGLLALALNVAFRLRTVALGRVRAYLGTALVSAFVVVEELSQLFIATRTFDLVDLLADTVGIALATLLSHALRSTMNAGDADAEAV